MSLKKKFPICGYQLMCIAILIIFSITCFGTTVTALNAGDINNDGQINITDVVLVMQYMLELTSLSTDQQIAADVNNDGLIDVNDAVLIMRKALGLIDEFPINPEQLPDPEKEDNKIIVPNLIQMYSYDALGLIIDAGLEVGNVRFEYHSSIPTDHVIHQAPTAGSDVFKGSMVDIIISIGPEPTQPLPPDPEPDPDPDYGDILPSELLYLFAEDGTYLGKLTTNQFDPDSIFNQFGVYGSQFSATSIWNRFGVYGSQFSSQSPFNDFTSTPPYIKTIDGKIVGRLTTNRFIAGAISPYDIENILLELHL